jgi:uncharacterized membrane protein
VAYDTSADGSVVVGFGEVVPRDGFPVTAAFYWTAATGMLDLREALTFGGATGLDGWTLLEAHGVSHDGLTVVGTAADPTGRTQAFAATVGAIPEPSTVALAMMAATGLLGFYFFNARKIVATAD